MPTAEADRGQRAGITRRRLQIALGVLWLLDGALQLQPFMYSRSFVPSVLGAAAAGQPHLLAVVMQHADHVMAGQLAVFNTGAALVQIAIGAGLLLPRTVKPALLISFGWSFSVWAIGEGFGMLLTGDANPLTGAPGAVLLYALAGLMLWPVDRPAGQAATSQGLLNDRGGRLAWTGTWLCLAALTMLPANLANGAASAAFGAGASTGPAPLATLDAVLGRLSAGHGLPIGIALAAAEAAIGLGILSNRWRNAAAILGAALALALWVTTEGLGGISTGQATDPNTGPLLLLLAAAVYVPAPAHLTPPTHEKEDTMQRRRLSATLVAAITVIILSISGLIAVALPAQGSSSPRPAVASAHFNSRQLAFHDAMRKLWEQHVLWTRLFIVSDVFASPDLSVTTTRLLANQTDIGNAVKPFYGTANGNHLTALLKRHILLAAQILAAAKAGDAAGLAQAEKEWYANANQIAGFLHHLNPRHWPLMALRMMMREHLNLTLAEAVDELTGKYAASVAEFNAVENEILGMADTLSNGIIAQFPGHF